MSIVMSHPGKSALSAPHSGADKSVISAAEKDSTLEASPDAAAADSALAARAANGDVDAFGMLVEKYQRPIAALVARMTGATSDIDDLVQEIFIRAWKGLPRFRGEAQFSTWLYRIAVNTAIRYRSKRKKEAQHLVPVEDQTGGIDALTGDVDTPAEQGGDPFQKVVAREQQENVRKAVLALPEKQRTVIALHYFQGKTCEEISQITGCSVGTVWSRLHYACKKMKGLLERNGGI